METTPENRYENLKLEHQLSFPLYACAKEVIEKYRTFLEEINLTYTQYITMMVMWEYKKISAKNTLTLFLTRMPLVRYIDISL